MKHYLTIVLLLLTFITATANHIFGGYIGFKTIDPTKGKYKFTLKYYIDVPAAEPGFDIILRTDPVNLIIYRKRDHELMDKVGVIYRNKTEVIFENVACAQRQNFEILVYEYDYDDIYLDPDKYTDPMGYYVAYDKCCRNFKIENIQSAADGSILFYTEFPALKENGQLLNYATPDFSILNGDYICRNKTFNYSVKANDDDGDQLKYKIVAPFRGDNTYFTGEDANPGPYSDVLWRAPYNSANPFGGSIPLKINSETGLITLRTNNRGVFLFSFAVEDYRNGKKMGLVRHDFQLPAVDCNLTPIPPPQVKYSNTVISELAICNGDLADLEANIEAGFNYQWQKDGINLENEIDKKLSIQEPGTYQLIKSLKSVCSNDTISNTVNVIFNSIQPKILASGPTLCNNQSVTLRVGSLTGYDLSWKFNTQEISKLDSIKITTPGNYYVTAVKLGSGCNAETDSVSIGYSLIDPLPLPNPNYFACKGETVKLQTVDKSNFRYIWTKNDSLLSFTTNTIEIKESGKYVVAVVDDKSCTAKSLPYDVELINPNTIKFDSLNPICASEHNKVNLFASPGGGQFSGPGVVDKSFDPSKAGVGIHNIFYKLNFSPTCKSEVSRKVEVVKVFELEFSPSSFVLTNSDDSVSVNAVTFEPNLAAHWHPDDFLKDHNSLNQKILPTRDITYNVVVINNLGCKIVKEVKFAMQSSFKELVYFPTAFSPNGDGMNDTFEIISKVEGIFEFKVFDRWGAEIYRETSMKPSWDGNINNQGKRLFPVGIYNAQLKLLDSPNVINFVIHVFY